MKNEDKLGDVVYFMDVDSMSEEEMYPTQRQKREHDINLMTTTLELQTLSMNRHYSAKDRNSNTKSETFPQDDGNKDTMQDIPEYSEEEMEVNYYGTSKIGNGNIIKEDFQNITCKEGEWLCNDTMQCIPLEQLCNGTTNCWNKPEEAHEICGRSYWILVYIPYIFDFILHYHMGQYNNYHPPLSQI